MSVPLGLQGTTVSPRFIFGVNGELKNNLYLIDETKLLYTAGHNVVVYSTDEKNQYFLQGSEGTEKITTIAISKQKKFLAICEKAEHAMCTIYDIHSQKKKKVLPDQDIRCSDYEAKEFLSACFDPVKENRFLITLTGEPDWSLLLWDWDKLKVMCKIGIGITGVPFSINQKGGDTDAVSQFQCMYNLHDSTAVCVVGVDTFRFIRITAPAGMATAEFEEEHTGVNNADRELTTKYVCQAWMTDGRLIVCTEVGEIFLCEENGSYMAYIPESPTDDNFKLEACVAFSRGFIVAGNENGNGKFYAFEKCEDSKVPYRLINKEPTIVRMSD